MLYLHAQNRATLKNSLSVHRSSLYCSLFNFWTSILSTFTYIKYV